VGHGSTSLADCNITLVVENFNYTAVPENKTRAELDELYNISKSLDLAMVLGTCL
jgi:hypothetical protein